MSSKKTLPYETTLLVRDCCLCLHVQRAARTLARRFDDALRPFGLTNGQFSLLMSLNRPEPPSMGPVASLLAMDRTTLTAALKPLERRGLVEVLRDPSDRRSRILKLTGEGQRCWPARCRCGSGPTVRWKSTCRTWSRPHCGRACERFPNPREAPNRQIPFGRALSAKDRAVARHFVAERELCGPWGLARPASVIEERGSQSSDDQFDEPASGVKGHEDAVHFDKGRVGEDQGSGPMIQIARASLMSARIECRPMHAASRAKAPQVRNGSGR